MMRDEQIGSARMILGDCLDIIPTLPMVAAVITDPPYGISHSPQHGGPRTGKRRGASNTYHPKSWWDAALDPEWGRVCEVAPLVVWFGHWRMRDQVEAMMVHPLRGEIVWAKDCHTGPPCPLAPRDERIWLFSASGIKPSRFEPSVWNEAIIPTFRHKDHLNQKPLHLMERLISWCAPSSVLDPFAGSGTTGVACAMLGIPFTGIEIERQNFDIACRRIEDAQRQQRMFA